MDDCINYQNLPLAILYSFCRERINNLVQNNVPVIDFTKSVYFCDGQHAAGRSVFVKRIVNISLDNASLNKTVIVKTRLAIAKIYVFGIINVSFIIATLPQFALVK